VKITNIANDINHEEFFENEKSQYLNLSFLNQEIKNFVLSKKRAEMFNGIKYYLGKHDILNQTRLAVGEGGELIEVNNLPNNKIVDNQYAKLVDQKVNYILSKIPKIQTENNTYLKIIENIFDKNFFRKLKIIGENCLNEGICWLHPYYNESGKFSFKIFNGHEILPFWRDSAHTELNFAIRVYESNIFSDNIKRKLTKTEVYGKNEIKKYVLKNYSCNLNDTFHEPHFFILKNNEEIAAAWGKVPLVAFKSNSKEIPLINKVKNLQDGINTIISDFLNKMQTDVNNTILVLKNYDGTDLGEFRRNLSVYGAVKVRTIDGQPGGIETLKIDVNSENYKAILSIFKHALIENGGGFDVGDERAKGNPNEITIQSMYTNIDLDSNGIENEFQASFEELMWFVNKHILNETGKDFTKEKIEIIFDRNMLINKSELINDCLKSKQIISNKTILDMHPFVKNTSLELERLKEEK
jgi:SPP1 family phage portal protein